MKKLDNRETATREIEQVCPDPVALKALTHPERLKMLAILRVDGPATATQLAAQLGLNSGATSYHLRQLARFGFIEELPTSSRRDRWWKARHELTSVPDDAAAPEKLEASLAFTQMAHALQVDQLRQAVAEYPHLPDAWRRASTVSDFILVLSPERAERLKDAIMGLILEEMRTAPPLGQPLPAGMAPVTVMLHAFPYPGRVMKTPDKGE
ncbi:winged helix-turn-helix domain-containing protein [Oryzifoliimicrobium ureilyticus]|uniref:winged helix-turn-helix domain-containing protein n=1 Tax=Oryzifoliimicrobium ureilyticus TaxID=3113724 RepID=UPI0030765B7D